MQDSNLDILKIQDERICREKSLFCPSPLYVYIYIYMLFSSARLTWNRIVYSWHNVKRWEEEKITLHVVVVEKSGLRAVFEKNSEASWIQNRLTFCTITCGKKKRKKNERNKKRKERNNSVQKVKHDIWLDTISDSYMCWSSVADSAVYYKIEETTRVQNLGVFSPLF